MGAKSKKEEKLKKLEDYNIPEIKTKKEKPSENELVEKAKDDLEQLKENIYKLYALKDIDYKNTYDELDIMANRQERKYRLISRHLKNLPPFEKILKEARDEGKKDNKSLLKDYKKSKEAEGSGRRRSNYKIHAVIFKKPYNLQTAKMEARHILKSKKDKFMRETQSSYRFRNIPKQKFISESFRTQKVNPNISIIYGQLK